MQLPVPQRLPHGCDGESIIDRAMQKWDHAVAEIPCDAPDIALRQAYWQAIGGVFDPLDMYFAEVLVALPFDHLLRRMKDHPCSFAAFSRDVKARGFYSLGSVVRGRILSGGHTLSDYHGLLCKVQLANGAAAFLAYSDFLDSNENIDDDEHLRQMIHESVQACRGLEMRLMMLSTLEDDSIIVSRKFTYPHPLDFLQSETGLLFDGRVLHTNGNVATVLMNVNWGRMGYDPLAYIVGQLLRSECDQRTWSHLRPETHLTMRLGECDFYDQELRFVPAAPAARLLFP